MSYIITKDLWKQYGEETSGGCALEDINIAISRGEFVAITGEPGSGKSALLNILATVSRPTNGQVFIDDMDMTRKTDDELAIFRRKHVDLIFPSYNLVSVLTAEENVLLPCKLDGGQMDEKVVDAWFDRLGLEEHRYKLPHQLSEEQRQKTALCRILLNRPAIILIDEPDVNLYTRDEEDLLSLLIDSAREHRQTLIIATANPEIAQKADRVLVLKDGKLIGEDES